MHESGCESVIFIKNNKRKIYYFSEMKTCIFYFLLLVLIPITTWSKDIVITNLGASGDGITDNTQIIQSAIDQVHFSGGGKVIIPQGEFLTGSIVLRSNIELHLERNAVLLGSTDPSDYKRLRRWKSLILADTQSNIILSGQGAINGRGSELALKIDDQFYEGLIDSSRYSFSERRPKEPLRPTILEFYDCRNILVEGVTLRNSACWVQSYERCKNLAIRNIIVDSDAYWNNDGIDIMDCRNVVIENCDINSADDGICLKSDDWDRIAYCENITIRNCRIRSSASAIKFGTASVSRIVNVRISNIEVYDTYRSAVAIESVQGGIIEDVDIRNIRAKNTGNAIFIRIGSIRQAKKPGILRNIYIGDLEVEVPFGRPDIDYNIRGPVVPGFHNTIPSSITGQPHQKVENIVLENITITYPGRSNKAYAHIALNRIEDIPELEREYPEFSMFGELPAWGFYVRHVDGLIMKNVELKVKADDFRPAIVLDDVSGVDFESLMISNYNEESIYLNNCPEADIDIR